MLSYIPDLLAKLWNCACCTCRFRTCTCHATRRAHSSCACETRIDIDDAASRFISSYPPRSVPQIAGPCDLCALLELTAQTRARIFCWQHMHLILGMCIIIGAGKAHTRMRNFYIKQSLADSKAEFQWGDFKTGTF